MESERILVFHSKCELPLKAFEGYVMRNFSNFIIYCKYL
jgi:hypothetical protein